MAGSEVEVAYRFFVNRFCPFFTGITIMVQSFLLYFIIFKSSGKMGTFRYILGHTSLCQLILLCIECFCQFRMISNVIPVEVRSYGPLRSSGSFINYTLHQGFQFWMFMSGMSIIVTIYFKLMSLSLIRTNKWKMVLTFVLFHIPVMISAALEIYLIFTVAYPQEIRDYYTKLNIDNSVYAVIGTMKLQTVSLINFFIMVGSVFVYPVASGFIRWRILNHLKQHLRSFSARNKAQHESFVKGLTIQSFLPFCTYIPPFALYAFCVYTKTEILFQQYFIYIMPTFPAFFDPFVTLYFVVPYRKTLQRWFGIKDKTFPIAPSAVSANLTTVQ